MRVNYVVAGTRPWNKEIFNSTLRKLPGTWIFIDQEEDLDRVYVLDPRYIFFLHWSKYIPSDIIDQFECVIFHPSHLPYGRGGSPIQNLIWRDYTSTKLTALRATHEVDAGPIYGQRELDLSGSARQVFEREMFLAAELIKDIIKNNPEPLPQEGHVVYFKRRQPYQSEIEGCESVEKVYNLIRMLDAEGYPPAFIELDGFMYEFTQAELCNDKITAQVVIRKS
jgi:methionyl-tRNA formyltransferase